MNLYVYSKDPPTVYTDKFGMGSEEESLKAGAATTEQFRKEVEQAFIDYGDPSTGVTVSDLMALINVESSGNPDTKSDSYLGLFQLSTKDDYNSEEIKGARQARFNKTEKDKSFVWTETSIFDPATNIRYGTFVIMERFRMAKVSIGRKKQLLDKQKEIESESKKVEQDSVDFRERLQELKELKRDRVTKDVKEEMKKLRDEIGKISGRRADVKIKQKENEKALQKETNIEMGNKLLDKFMRENPAAAAYLLHQQGLTGLRNLLKDPKASIGENQRKNLTPSGKKSVKTYEDHVNYWIERFAKAKSFVK